MKKRTCLFVGDGCVSSGFARMNHKYLESIHPDWEVHMMAMNYHGDPHPYPYKIYPCISARYRDPFGALRLPEMINKIRPDVISITNDPWNIPHYLKRAQGLPVVASLAVDGLNCRGEDLNGLKHAIFWTNFGLEQARLGGYTGPATVVPLGVDTSVFYPTAQKESRRRAGLPALLQSPETFIVGAVGRNQPRKRLDLTMMVFANWIKKYKITNAYLFLHVGPTGDVGYNLHQLSQYLGISNRIILSQPEVGDGILEENMRFIYSTMDVMISMTQGEGWGLTHMEGMACGVPQILPDWAALGEWARGAALLIPCTTVACTPNNINAVGGIADMESMVEALHSVYEDRTLLEGMKKNGLELVNRPEYDWNNIGQKYAAVLDEALAPVIV